MARYSCARWVPAKYTDGRARVGVPYTGGPRKVVHHKTVSRSENAANLYGKSGSWPHFTVGPSGAQQHFDTSVGSRALRNTSGGVQTNSDSAIQIEIVGMPGETMDAATMRHLVALLKEIEQREGIPWTWPGGRPPKTAADGYGERNGDRDARLWDTCSGHYGHSQVPENTHWDPAYTDAEWDQLNAAMAAATQTTKDSLMRYPASGYLVVKIGENGKGDLAVPVPFDKIAAVTIKANDNGSIVKATVQPTPALDPKQTILYAEGVRGNLGVVLAVV